VRLSFDEQGYPHGKVQCIRQVPGNPLFHIGFHHKDHGYYAEHRAGTVLPGLGVAEFHENERTDYYGCYSDGRCDYASLPAHLAGNYQRALAALHALAPLEETDELHRGIVEAVQDGCTP